MQERKTKTIKSTEFLIEKNKRWQMMDRIKVVLRRYLNKHLNHI